MGIYSLSFKNFKKKKLRSVLTMLGIIIGVVALVTLMGIGSGLTSYIKEETESMFGDITIMNSSSSFMTPGDAYISKETVDMIKNMPQLYNIQEQTQFPSTINNTPIYVIGLTDWNMVKISSGTQGVVIDRILVDKFGYKIGSEILVANKKMMVTGISNQSMPNGIGYVTLDLKEALPLNDNKISMITASTKSDPETVKKKVEAQVNGVTASIKSDFSKEIDDMMGGITIFVGAIASVALLVGIISIANIMLINVTERTREIGILKAIGFTNKEILISIIMEACLLGVIGAILGLIIASLLLQLTIIFIAPSLGMNINIFQMLPLWLISGVIIGSAILSVLAGAYPAWMASRLNVVEALRYE